MTCEFREDGSAAVCVRCGKRAAVPAAGVAALRSNCRAAVAAEERRPAAPPVETPGPAITGDAADLAKLAAMLTPCNCPDAGREQQRAAVKMLSRWPKPESDNGRWAVGVTTAPRRQGNGRGCIQALNANGWRPVLFAEPGTDIGDWGDCDIRWNDRRLGAWRNWRHAAETLLAERPDAELILIVQDDCLILPGARGLIDRKFDPWPADTGMLSLFLPGHYLTGRAAGFAPHRPGSLWMAQAMAFPRDDLRALLAHPIARSWRGVEDDSPPIHERRPEDVKNIDNAVGEVMKARRRVMRWAVPSLAQHVAPHSTIGHGPDHKRKHDSGRASRLAGDLSVFDRRPRPRLVRRPGVIRVGVLYSSIAVGGAEIWLRTLLRGLDPERFALAGVAVSNPEPRRPVVPDWPCDVTDDAAAVERDSDVLLAWACGHDRLRATALRFRGPIVCVSHNGNALSGVDMNRRHAPYCTRWAAVSDYCAAAYPPNIPRRGPRAIRVIPNGVEAPRPVDRAEARAKLGIGDRLAVGFVGRFADDKDPLSAARAVGALGDRAVAVYHGYRSGCDQGFRASVERAAGGRVIWRSPAEDTAETWAAIDAFVHTPQTEGFGLVYCEAWAAGVPVVSSLAGVAGDHPDAAVIVPALADGPTLAAAVERAVEGATVERGRELHRERYSAERMAAAWGEWLAEIAG